ncbi:hypothetical protein TNCT_544791 [Trichonephila clavata]|uniref:Uncharacterized protein n=1 Tax=Trichonephila clavata TaxID=2740835 RepID=A0A8X6F919_TRICU|nr:hypothetical protein TNCT_544791 [Trichonephila clavata]
MQPVRTSLRSMMFTYMHGLIHNSSGCLLIQGTGSLTLPIETSEILDLVPADSWRYVPTKMNPADIAAEVYHLKNFLDVVYGIEQLHPSNLMGDLPAHRATTSKQLMGDLPAHRVTPSRPFSACGVDYAGPINVLRYRGRGARDI